MVALGAGQAEQPLLEDRVAPVPQREREAQPALAVADAEQAVLAPAVGAAARVVVREVVPAVAVGRVVLAHRAPLPLGRGTAPSASSSARARRPAAVESLRVSWVKSRWSEMIIKRRLNVR